MRVLLEAPLTFDVPGGTVHSPMIHATVSGVATKLILDTGVDAHILTVDLATRAGLSRERSDPGTDGHTGASIESWSLGTVTIEIDGATARLSDVVAIDGPAPFERWGIGGFLSPQLLHPTAWTVMDLAGDTLSIVDAPASDMPSWLAAKYPALRAITVPREPAGIVSVRASIEPYAAVTSILDTGSSGTDFAAEAVPGLDGTQPERTGFGVGGDEVHGASVTGRTLRVGDATFPLEVLFVREHSDASHSAILGMDVLRGTVLAVTANPTQPVLWLVPELDRLRRPS